MDKNKIFSIPNILSFIRIALIPIIVYNLLADNYIFSAILIVLSGITDVVDGYIARHFNMITPLGKALDPIADKLTLLSIVLCMCFKEKYFLALFITFLVKEIIMGIEGLLIIKKTGTTYSAKWYGKISTAALYISMILHILWKKIPSALSYGLIVFCQASVVVSLILYTISNVKVLKAPLHRHEGELN